MSKENLMTSSQPIHSPITANVEGFDSLAELALAYALVVKPCHRRSMVAALRAAVGTHAEPVGSSANSVARQNRARAGRSRFSHSH